MRIFIWNRNHTKISRVCGVSRVLAWKGRVPAGPGAVTRPWAGLRRPGAVTRPWAGLRRRGRGMPPWRRAGPWCGFHDRGDFPLGEELAAVFDGKLYLEVAVGTGLAGGPPRRSRRAGLP